MDPREMHVFSFVNAAFVVIARGAVGALLVG